MKIGADTRLQELLKPYPFLLDFFLNRSPKFKMLKSAVVRKTVGNVAPLSHIAERGGIPLNQLMAEIVAAVKTQTGDELAVVPETVQASPVLDAEARQGALKGIIHDLHNGVDMAILKQRFHALIKDIDGTEIARMEQRLIAEGMPESEIKRLCDVHVELFKESLEVRERPVVPAGHPLHSYMLENRAAEKILAEISEIVAQFDGRSGKGPSENQQEILRDRLNALSDINLHYLRKENQLFPVLEKHEISGPSEVMWAIHDDIRQALKLSRRAVDTGAWPVAEEELKSVIKSINDMIYKEEHILFPMALEILSDEDWAKVRQGEEEIGYAWILPETGWSAEGGSTGGGTAGSLPHELDLDTGRMSLEVLNLMLTHLPVDISFVNEQDEVVYYSQGKERIFPRSPGVIGRKVQKCHPPKSMDVVQKILDAFRSGTKESAEFWIEMGGRFIHIRYFAVRDAEGRYKGTLEVSQDVTSIRALEGQRRLLDWE